MLKMDMLKLVIIKILRLIKKKKKYVTKILFASLVLLTTYQKTIKF